MKDNLKFNKFYINNKDIIIDRLKIIGIVFGVILILFFWLWTITVISYGIDKTPPFIYFVYKLFELGFNVFIDILIFIYNLLIHIVV